VDKQNNVIERTLMGKEHHENATVDLTVGVLDFDVPTNLVSYAKVLPDNYSDYIRDGRGLPCIMLNQNKEALVGDVSSIVSTNFYKQLEASALISKEPNRLLFGKFLQKGDSGNPMFIMINGQPVLMTVWTSTLGPLAFGASVTVFKKDINTLMTLLGGGYQLEEIDLSGFNPLPPQE
jgi:hypothetical protein